VRVMKSHTDELRQIANKLAKGELTCPPFTHSQNWRGKLAKRIRKVASEVVLFDAAINLIRQHTEISEDARLGVCDNCGRLISYEQDVGWYHIEMLEGFEYSGECGKPEKA